MNLVSLELALHLEYKPFLQLPIEFDKTPLLKEAVRLRPYYTSYLERTEQWTTLGLRTPGGISGGPFLTKRKMPWQDSVYAQQCPETKKFLAQLVEWENCSRIRYRLLQPFSKVGNHRDGDSKSIHLSLNISLNMPRGCIYYSDLNADGSLHAYTQKIPFRNRGSIFLVNNAKYHKLDNFSARERYHLTVAGPLKISQTKLLRWARTQNKVSSLNEIRSRLIEKKRQLNEPIHSDSALHFFSSRKAFNEMELRS
jgi:hypothetical protein